MTVNFSKYCLPCSLLLYAFNELFHKCGYPPRTGKGNCKVWVVSHFLSQYLTCHLHCSSSTIGILRPVGRSCREEIHQCGTM
jgi:hypothetical protein